MSSPKHLHKSAVNTTSLNLAIEKQTDPVDFPREPSEGKMPAWLLVAKLLSHSVEGSDDFCQQMKKVFLDLMWNIVIKTEGKIFGREN